MTTSEATRIVLRAETAADLMTANTISIRDNATVREAVVLLTGKGFSAAPVIDDAGRAVGVLSRSDILVHNRERKNAVDPFAGLDETPMDLTLEPEAETDLALVRDLMTPVVFSVTPKTPAQRVIEDLLSLHVHRLFVVDAAGVLVGVISMADVLRNLRPEEVDTE